jgi:hypothetical protein
MMLEFVLFIIGVALFMIGAALWSIAGSLHDWRIRP